MMMWYFENLVTFVSVMVTVRGFLRDHQPCCIPGVAHVRTMAATGVVVPAKY